MKLNRLHIAEGCNSGLQRNGGRNTFGDDSVRRNAVEPSGAAAGNRSGLGEVSSQLSRNEISNHRAITAPAVMNQCNGFRALVYRDLVGDGLIAHGIEHRVAGSVGHITSPPLVGAAERALRNQTMGFVALGNRNFLAVNDDVAIASGHPAPGQPPRGELATSSLTA